jgi:4'-phosphopantetheinyl transferase
LLNDQEYSRRESYREAIDRDRFTLGVALTRTVLGAALGTPAARVPIERRCVTCNRPHGRPRLTGTFADLHFSVSHSGDRVVAAVAIGVRPGVDVEQGPRQWEPALLDLVLSADERADVDRLAPADRDAAFLRYWVRKEAVLKATGDGLTVALNDLTVSAMDQPARLRYWRGHPSRPSGISMRDLAAGTGYSACLAAVGPLGAVVEFDANAVLAAPSRPS